MTRIKPPRLRRGDTVALVSPSSPVPSVEHLDRMLACLESFGLKTVVGESVTIGSEPAPVSLRLADMNRAIRDSDTKAIFCAWGGAGARELLAELDYDCFLRMPKVFVGLSDPSCIVTALQSRTGVVTFHGLTGVDLSDPAGLDDYSRSCFVRALFTAEGLGSLPVHSEWRVLRGGNAQGPLVGGNLSRTADLLGTPCEPAWDGSIFLWEVVGGPPNEIAGKLAMFREAGVFDRIAGMVIARPLDDSCLVTPDEWRIILEVIGDRSIPILANVDAGHSSPKLTLPIGVPAELMLDGSAPIFTIVEAGVE